MLARWADTVPELAALDTLDALLAGWADPAHTHRISTGLVRLAAADGARDDDALLLLLHLLSGLVWRLATGLGDLSPDITTVVISELTCQLRAYRWRVRTGWLIPNLDTRRAVLAELRPSDRYHADRVEQLTDKGILYRGTAWPSPLLPRTRTSTSSACCCGPPRTASPRTTSSCSWPPSRPAARAGRAPMSRWPRRAASRRARCCAAASGP